jgi:hypothetical protein
MDNSERFKVGWDPTFHDYRQQPAQIGSHEAFTQRQIKQSDVFIAVLHREYYASTACLAELRLAVAESTRRKGSERSLTLVFLMIQDNPDLRDWWKKEREPPRGVLSGLPPHTAYIEGWLIANAKGPGEVREAVQRLQELGAQIRHQIDTDDDTSAPRLAAPSQSRRMAGDLAVLLGAPLQVLSPDATIALDRLDQRLRATVSDRAVRLADGWASSRQRAQARQSLIAINGTKPLIVQTCDAEVLDDLVLPHGLAVLRDRIQLVLPGDGQSAANALQLILWLPRNIDGVEFTPPSSDGLSTSPGSEGNNAFDEFQWVSPEELATQLIQALGYPLHRLELVIRDPGASPIDALLEEAFRSILGEEAVSTGLWSKPDGLRAILANRRQEHAKIVVATHDLNGSAFDLEQAEERLLQDAREIAQILQGWRATLPTPPACVAALVRHRTRDKDIGITAKILYKERFRYIRVDESGARRDDVTAIVNSLEI